MSQHFPFVKMIISESLVQIFMEMYIIKYPNHEYMYIEQNRYKVSVQCMLGQQMHIKINNKLVWKEYAAKPLLFARNITRT